MTHQRGSLVHGGVPADCNMIKSLGHKTKAKAYMRTQLGSNRCGLLLLTFFLYRKMSQSMGACAGCSELHAPQHGSLHIDVSIVNYQYRSFELTHKRFRHILINFRMLGGLVVIFTAVRKWQRQSRTSMLRLRKWLFTVHCCWPLLGSLTAPSSSCLPVSWGFPLH